MKIWITGAGLVTALGLDVETTWRALVEGHRGFRRVSLFDTEGHRATFAAESAIPPPSDPAWSRTAEMAVRAAREAVDQARVSLDDAAPLRIGLVVGGTTGGMLENERTLARFWANAESREVAAEMVSHPLTAPTDCVAEALSLPIHKTRTLASACSSGANALVVAAEWIRSGEVDLVVAGASDGLCRLTFGGFSALAALDPEPCRPFDRARAGMSLGEGAGFLVLESTRSVAARRAEPLAALAGWASGAEAHHITHPEPSGAVPARLIERALRCARLSPSFIDYVNAHGTGTPLNDPMEVRALRAVFGQTLDHVPVSSSKGQLGHTLGAAGAIEAVLSVLAIRRGVIPPTVGLRDPDPECRLDHVRVARSSGVRAVLSNSFGFGGMNAALVFSQANFDASESMPANVRIASGSEETVQASERSSVVVTGVAVVVPEDDSGTIAPRATEGLDPERARRLDRVSRLTVAAATRAIEAAQLPLGEGRTRVGVVFGTAFGSVDGSAAFMHRVVSRGVRFASPADFPNLVPSAPAGHVSIGLGLGGPSLTVCDLYTSGEASFLQALEIVESGLAEAMVAGALVEASDIVERGLRHVFANGGGSNRSEGGAVFVLEKAEHARARGVPPLARVAFSAGFSHGPPPSVPSPAGPRPMVASVGWNTRRPREVPDAWSGAETVRLDARAGDHEARGALVLAEVVRRLADGRATSALVEARARPGGYLFVLEAG